MIMAKDVAMTSNKPYLIRALNEWILDNRMTPFLLVDANIEGVEVPQQHVKDGEIILNVAPGAVYGIAFENEWIYFSARFNDQVFMINIPVNAVLAIYARENGQGMMFAQEDLLAEDSSGITQNESRKKAAELKPVLSIVK